MSSSDPGTDIRLSAFVARPMVAALAVLACLAAGPGSAAASQTQTCDDEASALMSKTGLPAAIRARIERTARQAPVLSRFHRSREALAKLDSLAALLGGPVAQRLEEAARTEVTNATAALRNCVTSAVAPALSTVTIRVFTEDDTRSDGRGAPAGAGVYLDVDGIPIGRSDPKGALVAQVPAGKIEIHATEYPSSWGTALVDAPPGGSRTVSIVMAGDKEPSEDSDLVVEEAPDGILPASSASLTLKFVQDDRLVTIEHIDDIELSDAPGESTEAVEEFFTVNAGVIRAADVPALFERIEKRPRTGRLLALAAMAIDTEGRTHYGTVRFQLGRFRLAVRLAAPPSNPALSVANIPIRVSVIGSDIAMNCISDANGRFEMDSLPDATIEFDAHTAAANNHYYLDATVTLCADRSVTLRMRNVEDLVAGVRAVTLDPGSPPCPPVPRR
jgi:hypothetical protein